MTYKVFYSPQECDSRCEDRDCHYSHKESWHIWKDDRYIEGPFDNETSALQRVVELNETLYISDKND